MSPLDAAWSLLKSRPASPGGREYSPPELQRLRAFVHANIDSPDPALRAQAMKIEQELTQAMSHAHGQGPEIPQPEARSELGAPDMMANRAPVAVEGFPPRLTEDEMDDY